MPNVCRGSNNFREEPDITLLSDLMFHRARQKRFRVGER